MCIIIHTYNKLFKEGMEMYYFSESSAFFLFKGLKAISLSELHMKLAENV